MRIRSWPPSARPSCSRSPLRHRRKHYRSQSNRATGETYHVEIQAGFWNPTPELRLAVDFLDVIGTEFDLRDDLGIEKARFGDFRLVLRPATRHKFRVSYIPIEYDAESVLRREIVFNGTRYPVGLPVNTTFEWKAWRVGYEHDFIYRDRGFLGFIVEAKWTDVDATIASPLATEMTTVKAPIPALGLIGRAYLAPNLALTGEFTGFHLPGDVFEDDAAGSYYDFDVYGTLNVTNHVGVSAGFRSITVTYRKDEDFGDFTMRGPYVAAVVRF